MKIKKVTVNTRKKSIDIETLKGDFSLPFAKLRLKPSSTNKIVNIFIDPEIGYHGLTYTLQSGKEDSIHVDAFLDYNRDPDFMRELMLHQLSLTAISGLKKSGLSKHEVIRRLNTSPSQLYRLLDPSNYKKSIDEMLRLLSVLEYEVKWNIVKMAA